MMVIQTMKKSVNGVVCDVEVDGLRAKWEIAITQLDTDLRSMDFENLPEEVVISLSNRDDFCEFQKAVWRFVDGEDVELPAAISAG